MNIVRNVLNFYENLQLASPQIQVWLRILLSNISVASPSTTAPFTCIPRILQGYGHENMGIQHELDAVPSLYRTSNFSVVFLGEVQDINFEGSLTRDSDVQLIDRIEEAQVMAYMQFL